MRPWSAPAPCTAARTAWAATGCRGCAVERLEAALPSFGQAAGREVRVVAVGAEALVVATDALGGDRHERADVVQPLAVGADLRGLVVGGEVGPHVTISRLYRLEEVDDRLRLLRASASAPGRPAARRRRTRCRGQRGARHVDDTVDVAEQPLELGRERDGVGQRRAERARGGPQVAHHRAGVADQPLQVVERRAAPRAASWAGCARSRPGRGCGARSTRARGRPR